MVGETRTKGIRTVPLLLVARTRGTGATQLMGSFTIPKNKRGQVTVQKFICGSADTWFAVTATAGSAGTRGTVDIHYMEARGQETIIGAIDEPILSLSPGTVNVRMIANGTATWNGVRMRTDLV